MPVPDPLEGPRWPSNLVTWSFATVNLTGQPVQLSDLITNPAYQQVVENAAAAWSAVSGVQLQLVPDSASVDIRVGFETFDPMRTGTIGSTAWAASGPYFVPGTIVAVEDPAQDPLIPTGDGNFQYAGFVSTAQQVFQHELGHALGLAHNTTDPNAVMNPAAGPANNAGPDQSDIAAIQALYGPPPGAAAPTPSFMYDPNVAIVREDYLTGLGREPDPTGLAGWVNVLASGATPGQLAQDLTMSQEFLSLHSRQTNPQYVESLYENGLGRMADPGGLRAWTGALQVGSLDRAGVLAGIAQSPESQQRLQWA
jgi:predicted Zn-dependent protease